MPKKRSSVIDLSIANGLLRQAPLRNMIKDIAETRVRYGYRRMTSGDVVTSDPLSR